MRRANAKGKLQRVQCQGRMQRVLNLNAQNLKHSLKMAAVVHHRTVKTAEGITKFHHPFLGGSQKQGCQLGGITKSHFRISQNNMYVGRVQGAGMMGSQSSGHAKWGDRKLYTSITGGITKILRPNSDRFCSPPAVTPAAR